MACEVIVDDIGENDFGDLVSDEFKRPRYEPCELHEEIDVYKRQGQSTAVCAIYLNMQNR